MVSVDVLEAFLGSFAAYLVSRLLWELLRLDDWIGTWAQQLRNVAQPPADGGA